MAAGAASKNEEWLTFASDGHQILAETIKTPMVDAEGKLIGVISHVAALKERISTQIKVEPKHNGHSVLHGSGIAHASQ